MSHLAKCSHVETNFDIGLKKLTVSFSQCMSANRTYELAENVP